MLFESFLVSKTGDVWEHHVPNIYRYMNTAHKYMGHETANWGTLLEVWVLAVGMSTIVV